MKRKSLLVWVMAMAALYFLSMHKSDCAADAPEKIGLRVLYVGHPGTSREKDFVEFLRKHFAKVGKGDLGRFREQQADGFDVVILDYDGDGFDSPRPQLSRGYTRATVTVGVTGARIASRLRLKTRYT